MVDELIMVDAFFFFTFSYSFSKCQWRAKIFDCDIAWRLFQYFNKKSTFMNSYVVAVFWLNIFISYFNIQHTNKLLIQIIG